MISPIILALVALLYLMLLFAAARYGDTRGKTTSLNARTTIYPLSLAIYCTTWTFFGSVGLATTSGISFLSIYIGPILMMTLGYPILKRIVSLSKCQRTTSVADFLGARYGKNVWVAATATCISVIGAVPYISLQLKAVALSLSEIMSSKEFGVTGSVPFFGDIALIIVIGLAVFTILFGTRHADATEHQYGLMLAIALESAIKLAAFLTVGIFVTYFMFNGIEDLFTRASAHPKIIGIVEKGIDFGNMAVLTLLSFLAFLMLPRQFHVAVVENQTEQELSRARWLFPLYLIAINLFVLPIAAAGILTFGNEVNGDGFVLALPASVDNKLISLVGFIGGLSAGTAMVIVACVALAIMISNHLVLPVYLRGARTNVRDNSSMEKRILIIRRTAISVILALAYLYYKAADNSQALASIGLVSFAAAAQLAPSMFLGLVWRRANAAGAVAGMVIGFLIWLYMLFLPTLNSSGGYWGLPLTSSLKLEAMGVSTLTAGFLLSVGMNLLALIAGSILTRPGALDSYQAQVFISHRGNDAMDLKQDTSLLTINQVNTTLISYLGRNRAKRAYSRYWEEADHVPNFNDPASGDYIRFSEETLASAIGSSSSRLVHSLLLKRYQETSSANLQLLDEASVAIQYNQSVLRNALDQLDQGITVFDAKFRLTFCNRQFRKLLNLPQETGEAGTPMAQIIRQVIAIQKIETMVTSFEDIETRLHRLSETWGLALPKAERILEIRSSPMPDGGLVISWTDVTERMMVAEALHEANEGLEKRVEERTSELVSANKLLEQATNAADLAYQSKTRFLAAAGHDLLQPLNAAKLYASTLQEKKIDKEAEKLTGNISRSLESVEEILGSVLAISRLDSTTHEPSFSNYSLQRIFEQIEVELRPIADEKNIDLRIVETSIWVRTDPAYLRRLVQNLVSNAINYTERGTVLLGCRRRSGIAEISVIDTGLGISPNDRVAIFSEFERLESGARLAPGLGLGLSIVERISKLLDHPIHLESELGKGTHFTVKVPRTMAESTRKGVRSDANQHINRDMNGLKIICIDNDQNILEGMSGLLAKWNCTTLTALSGDEALEVLSLSTKKDDTIPAIALVDFHLDRETGLDVIKRLRAEISEEITYVLVTADRSNELKKKADSFGIGLLNKPVKPAALRALLSQIQLQKRAAE